MQHLNLCPLWSDYVDKFRIGNWYEEPMCSSESSISYVEEEGRVYYFKPTVRKVVPTNQFWYRSQKHQIIEPTTPTSFIGADGQPLEILSHVHDKSLKLNVITLSGEIKELGQNLYYKSEDRGKFRAIYMPDSVETIGEQAFRQIGYGIHMQYSNNLKTLGTKSMTGDGFTDVYLPDSVEYIGPHCFSYSGIQRLRLPNNPNLSCGDQTFVFTWDLYNVVLPDSITELPLYFLDESAQLQTVKLPASLSSLGYGALANCKNLHTVEMSDSVTHIGQFAFADNDNLENIQLPKQLSFMDKYAFQQCFKLKTPIIIPGTLKAIPQSAFVYCESLPSVTFEEGVEEIQTWAFGYCSSLESVVLPNSMRVLGPNAFYECPNLKTVELNQGLIQLDKFCLASTGITSVHVPSSVQSIGYGSIAWNNFLSEVIIEEGVQAFDDGAFQECPLLTEITYTGTIANWEAIAKHTDWALYTPLSVIHCSDGDITL